MNSESDDELGDQRTKAAKETASSSSPTTNAAHQGKRRSGVFGANPSAAVFGTNAGQGRRRSSADAKIDATTMEATATNASEASTRSKRIVLFDDEDEMENFFSDVFRTLNDSRRPRLKKDIQGPSNRRRLLQATSSTHDLERSLRGSVLVPLSELLRKSQTSVEDPIRHLDNGQSYYGNPVVGTAPVPVSTPSGGTVVAIESLTASSRAAAAAAVANQGGDKSKTRHFFVTGTQGMAVYRLRSHGHPLLLGKCRLAQSPSDALPEIACTNERVYLVGRKEIQSFSIQSAVKSRGSELTNYTFKYIDVHAGSFSSASTLAVDWQGVYIVGTAMLEVRDLRSLRIRTRHVFDRPQGDFCSVTAGHNRICVLGYQDIMVFRYESELKRSKPLEFVGTCRATPTEFMNQERILLLKLNEKVSVTMDPTRPLLYACGGRYFCVYEVFDSPRLISHYKLPTELGSVSGGHHSCTDGRLVYIVGANGVAALSVDHVENLQLLAMTNHDVGSFAGGASCCCTHSHVIVAGIRGVKVFANDVARWAPIEAHSWNCDIM